MKDSKKEVAKKVNAISGITTILPTYKRPALLKRAIDSVRSQTWKNIVIVVRDNCSEDTTESCVLDVVNIDSRIKYIKNNTNIGAIDNIKLGLKSVETEFFSILSDDDFLEPEFYAEAMRLFDQYPDAGFVAFRVNMVNLDGKVLNEDIEPLNLHIKNYHNPIKSTYYNSEDGIDGYLHGIFPYTWTGYVFKKNVFSVIGFPDFSEVGYGADILFIWHAAARFNFVISNFKAANFTLHSNSVSSTLVKCFDERFLYWWRNRILIIKNDAYISDAIKNKISKYYLTHSTKSFNNFKYYASASTLLMIDRVKKKQFEELSFDFIAMRSFLSWPILMSIKFAVFIFVYLKLEGVFRFLILTYKKGYIKFK